MATLRSVLVAVLALALPGCATTSPSSGAEHGLARLAPEELERLMPTPAPRLPPAELVRLSKEGAAAQQLIARIKETGSRYALSAAEIIALHTQGVSTQVLDYIQSAREQDLRDRLAEEINRRERRHADELQREQARCAAAAFYCDRWWPAYPGYGRNYPYPLRPFADYYRGR